DAFFSVTLKFGGQPKTLTVPYAAITQFWDPSIDYRLRFHVPEPPPKPAALPGLPAKAGKPAAKEAGRDAAKDGDSPNIVSLDQFRKK
ncbi:MAG TPA: ClpXP protease specificity-enhancing factor SspB, partial [Phenylobacterium sp.]|nr:ClpXP protease specificity-enhancing factor SspB [Phenylobacterium sp.]